VRRRAQDGRPPIEVIGEDPPSADRATRVEIGREGVRRGRAAAAAAAAVATLLIGGLALNDDDQDEAGPPSTGADDRPTTTASTAAPYASTTSLLGPAPGPVLGRSAEAVLVFGGGPDGIWRQLDLDTGVLQGVEALEGVTGDALVGSPVPVWGGVILGDRNGPRFVPLPGGAPTPFEPAAGLEVLGQVAVLLESGRPDRVWVVRTLFSRDGADDTFGVSLSGIDGRGLTPEFEVPTMPLGATADGVLYAAGGRVYLATPGGTRSLAVGELQDSNATQVAVLACDAISECAVEVVDVASGASRRGPVMPGGASGGYSVLLSPTGWLVITHADPKFTVSLTDPSGRTSQIGVSDLRADPTWLPGDLGLVAITGSAIVRFFERDGQIITERVGDIRPGFGEDTLVVVPKG
jgi:hypothetical protein